MTYDALRAGRRSEIGRAYHVTVTTADRTPLFTDFSLARQAIHHPRRVDGLGFTETLAWVLMPDHLHWLLVLRKGTLSGALRSMKGGSARAINLMRDANTPVWQRAYYDHALRDDEDLLAAARYIVANPLRAGLAPSIGLYAHWDSVWL